MSGRRWSIAGRATRWFVLTVATLVITVSGLSAWYLHRSVDQELDSLVVEELHEMRPAFTTSPGTPRDFATIAAELEGDHPATPLAWRVTGEDGELWGEFGHASLLVRLDAARGALERTSAPSRELRIRTEPVGHDLYAELVLDGSEQWRLMSQYRFYVFGLGGLVAGAAVLGWLFLLRRISRLLHRVAEELRSVHALEGAAIEAEDAPAEIADVADALSEMLSKVRKESERARLMTAGLAHELRSPLQNLLGETEVTLLRDRDASEYKRVLESHGEELSDLSRVVDNLVTLCSPRAKLRRDQLERFDLGLESDLRLGKDRTRAEAKRVRLELELRGDLELEGDREAILLAVRNLVSNAVEWSPEGGRVRVAIEGEERLVSVTVDDSGPGVPAEEREHIFTPFYRGPSIDGRRVGYGLGLALTRSAVESHGGRIEVSTAPLGGARFHVALPREPRVENDRAPVRAAQPKPQLANAPTGG